MKQYLPLLYAVHTVFSYSILFVFLMLITSHYIDFPSSIEKHFFRPVVPKSGPTSESFGVLVKYIILCSTANLESQNFFEVRPTNLYFFAKD